MGGSLVSVSNIYENGYISDLAARDKSDQFWIGINYLASTQWTWINLDPSSYRNWALGQSLNQNSYACGAVGVGDNLWRATACNIALPYMCQFDPNAASGNGCPTSEPVPDCPTLATCPPPPVCPTPDPVSACPTLSQAVQYALRYRTVKFAPLFQRVRHRQSAQRCLRDLLVLLLQSARLYLQYQLARFRQLVRLWDQHHSAQHRHQFKLARVQEAANFATYNDSLKICSDDNATLPIILNGVDNSFIAKNYNYDVWIGLICRSAAPASCTWQDGTFLGYENFAPGYPEANEYSSGFGVLSRHLNPTDPPAGTWRTFAESSQFPLLCQKMGIR